MGAKSNPVGNGKDAYVWFQFHEIEPIRQHAHGYGEYKVIGPFHSFEMIVSVHFVPIWIDCMQYKGH